MEWGKEESGWDSAYKAFQEKTLPRLKAIGKQIGADSDAGNYLAQDIIRLYAMLQRSFDPITDIRLQETLEKYEQEKK